MYQCYEIPEIRVGLLACWACGLVFLSKLAAQASRAWNPCKFESNTNLA